MRKVIILGAGITGLTLAYELQKQGDVDITIVEKSDRVGGWMRTDTQDGFLFERGPRSLRRSGGEATLKLAEELELPIIEADRSAAKRYLYRSGQLKKLGLNFSLLRAIIKERFQRRSDASDESIFSFFSRRIGEELTHRYIDPMTKGIYAGDIHKLSMRACFPRLWNYEQTYGSVVKGMRKNKGPRGLYSFQDGLESLPKAIANRLDAEILFNHTADTSIEADEIYSCIPDPDIPRNSLFVVSIGYRKQVLKKPGFGYLIPGSENEQILGAVWDSYVFPQHNSSPDETRITVMLANETSKAEILAGLERHLDVTAEPDSYSSYTAKQAVPQYELGHFERVRSIAAANPKLTLAGSSYFGVSVNDCIANATALASPS